MNIEQRFNYYIKNWKNKETIKITDSLKKFKQNELIFYPGPNSICPDNFNLHYGCWNEMFWWKQKFSLDFPCLSISADGIDNKGLPAIVKVRYIDNKKGGILGLLAYGTHWGNCNKKLNIIPWNKKINDCIWRGSPSGVQDSKEEPKNWKNSRMKLCYKWKDRFNVAIVNDFGRWDKTYLKPKIKIEEMLKYKYIISIPGNDKDSGLNWKLASNSVVLMAIPTIESWLMEGLLKPWFHFVPLKDDYSDLEEKVNWCKNNDKKCQIIVNNANKFMEQFKDIKVEEKIFNKIKDYYKSTFKFV